MRVGVVGRIAWVVGVLLVFAPMPQAAVVIYRETFGTAATADPGLPTTFDWSVHSSATGTFRSVGSGVTNQANVSVSGAAPTYNSKPTMLLNVNAGEPTSFPLDTNADTIPDSNARGVAYISGTAWGANSADRRALVWTPEYSFNPADYVAGSIKFSWHQGNGNALDALNLAVRIGGQWYVSKSGFTNTAVTAIGNFPLGDDSGNGGTAHGSELKSLAFTTAASDWNLLTFDGTFDATTDTGVTSTVGLALGAAAASDLPGGPITAFGIFSNDPQITGAGNRRFDTFTIEGDAVPEPGALLASLVALPLLLRGRARRVGAAI
jgi:hypothetical protein